jgi:hypothetical protein
MKHFLVFILLLTYAVASTGTTVQLHFCMGKLASSTWKEQSKKKTCGKCGMKKQKPNGCCKDEAKWVKLQDDQKTTTASVQFDHFEPALPVHGSAFDITPAISNSFKLAHSHAPPRSCDISIYKRNCVFLI